MLKQSFTAENFRKIFDYENRKGENLEEDFFPDIAEITKKLKACKQNLRALKKKKSSLSKDKYEEEQNKIREKRSDLKKKREDALTQELEKTSAQVTHKGFEIKLKEVSLASGRKLYPVEVNPASYFAIKQIQYNFQKLYKVKQSNRYEIIRQLTNVLDNNFPKYVIRTDIHRFYESIPRNKILEKINKDPLLTHISKKIIRHILNEYRDLSKSDVGVPTGVGVSAYLSELHMRSFDETIINHPEVAYYARYVDDIVVVFFPKPESQTSKYIDFIKSEVRKEGIGLELNDGEDGRDNKTQQVNLLSPDDKVIEYLGYRIEFGGETADKKYKHPRLDLSQNKIDRYKERIDLAFEQHNIHKKTNKKAADKTLVKRMLFLSGNTRLVGSKRHALVGIYYSNSLLAIDCDSLVELDKHLKDKIKALKNGWVKKRLKRMSFKEGFIQRSFARFSSNELKEIVRAWKHEEA